MQPADVARGNRERGQMAHLSAAIQHVHHAMEDLPDPAAKSKLAAALNTLTTVQENCHKTYAGMERHES